MTDALTAEEQAARYGAEPNRTPIPADVYEEYSRDCRAWRQQRYTANRDRMPAGWVVGSRNLYGRNERDIVLPPDLLATLTDGELVDLADGGYGAHFGGHVQRDPDAGTATITVYID